MPKLGKIHIFFMINFFEVRDFHLNWLHKRTYFIKAFFPPSWFFLTAQFFATAFVNTQLFHWKSSNFATSCWKMELFRGWFFFKLRDLLRKYAIASSKISKIRVFTQFIFIILWGMILSIYSRHYFDYAIYSINIQIIRRNHQNRCIFKIGSWITGFTNVYF